jgi:ubiquinone/menaquinone biosynthesis C-methylase UbiE
MKDDFFEYIRDEIINNNDIFKHEIDFLIQKKNKYNILDFGGGNKCAFQNVVESKIKNNNFIITTIDIQKPRTDVSKNYIQYDGSHIPFPDNYFDIIICNFVLHHIPLMQQDLIIQELSRVCKKSIMIIEDIQLNPIGILFSKLHYIFFRQSPSMIHSIHSEKYWINLIENFGFQLKDKKRIKGRLPGIEHVYLLLNKK